jgi:CDP-diacylglycerol--glycerol-3-phosphate 3-phosphatidyltransferase
MGKDLLHTRVRRVLDPLVGLLARLGVRPIWLTLAGLALSGAAAAAICAGRGRLGALFLAVGGLCDTLDGPVARARGAQTKFGAFIDSTIDRYAEVVVFAALAWRYRDGAVLVAAVVALSGSLLVSYTRARAEGLGEECRVGMLERPERLVLLIGALLAGWSTVPFVLWLLAVLTHVTALQRIVHIARRTAGKALAGS